MTAPMNTAGTDGEREGGARVMKCEEIRSVLFEYLTRELGPARSDLVREHLRKCDRCQAEAVQIQATIRMLRSAAEDRAGLPDRLSEERRARMRWASSHPVLDWMYERHVVVSMLVALAVIVAVVVALRWAGLRRGEEPEPGPTVTIVSEDELPGE